MVVRVIYPGVSKGFLTIQRIGGEATILTIVLLSLSRKLGLKNGIDVNQETQHNPIDLSTLVNNVSMFPYRQWEWVP